MVNPLFDEDWTDAIDHNDGVFVYTREDEFALRLQGYSYMQIAKAGGGILNTIKTTRNASEELLFDLAKKRIEKMMELGTTTLEAKSATLLKPAVPEKITPYIPARRVAGWDL